MSRLSKYWNRLKPGDKIATLALIVAIFSIGFGAWQAIQTDRVAHANVKPLLDISSFNYINDQHQNLRNYGLGPAVITNVRFYKNGHASKSLMDFIKLPYNATYDSVHGFGDPYSYVKSGEDLNLAKLTSNSLEQQKFNKTQIKNIMFAWERGINGTQVEIDYEDILGEKQKTLQRTLYFRNWESVLMGFPSEGE